MRHRIVMHPIEGKGIPMRTTVDLPEGIVRRARKACGARTKTETLIRGLEALVREERLSRLWALRGRVPLEIDLKASRRR
jgi:hypothetical protein